MTEQEIQRLHDELMDLSKEQIVKMLIRLKNSYQKVCEECSKLQSWQEEHMSLEELLEEYFGNTSD